MVDQIGRPPMPKDPPEYYTRYSIPTIDGYYFWDQGGWTWKIGKAEKPHADEAEEYHAGTPVTVTTRADYHTTKYKGKWREVWTDTSGRDYIIAGGLNQRYYLDKDWWKTYTSRGEAERHGQLEDVPKTKQGWMYKPGLPSVPDLSGVELPKLGLGAKLGLGVGAGMLGIIGVVVLVIVLLLALGYSGVGKATGTVAEGEYVRRRK